MSESPCPTCGQVPAFACPACKRRKANGRRVNMLIWAFFGGVALVMGGLTRDPMLVALLSLPVLGWYLLVIRPTRTRQS